MCMTDLELRQFFFFVFCPIWPTCAFSAVVFIPLTRHHLTIAISYWPKVSLVPFSYQGVSSYIEGVKITFSLHFWLNSQKNQPTLDWKFRNCWTNRLQKLPRKCFSFLREKKTASKKEKKINASFLTYQVRWCSFHISYTQVAEACFFFQLLY